MTAQNVNSVDQAIRFIDSWPKPARAKRIVVAGDFMFDHYVYGNAQRLSPDAPVPVLAIEDQKWVPGGASNVCLDLIALRCKVSCLGIVGKDRNGFDLKKSLKEKGCTTTGLIDDPSRPTTIKQNFVGLAQHRHAQKMFRVDTEDKSPASPTIAQKLMAAGDRLIARADALIIEDYNKGAMTPAVCQHLIKTAKQHKIPVLVDPAAIEDYTKYRGATTITPNATEACLATGMTPSETDLMAKTLLRELKLQTVVLTLDKRGALLLVKGKKPIAIPTEARSVYDVTGAGDMVIAMLAASLANGADWPMSVSLSNVAAGLEVEKFGVVPIELDEVLIALLQKQHAELGKIRTVDQLLPEITAYRKQGKKIAFTNGCFDILHAGHVAYLRQAKAQGDILVLGVNSDASIRKIKGKDRPVNKQDDRLMVLSELASVDYVIVFDKDTPMDLLRAIKPDVLVKGGDYTKDKVVGHEFVESYGGQVTVVGLVEGRSTTNIIQKIEATKR